MVSPHPPPSHFYPPMPPPGVPKNEVEGCKLLRLAADAGHSMALNNLANFYLNGIPGVLAVDLKEAVMFPWHTQQLHATKLMYIKWHAIFILFQNWKKISAP